MKKIFLILAVSLISFSTFATDKKENIRNAMEVVKGHFKGDYANAKKWVIYDLNVEYEGEDQPNINENYPPVMIYLVSGTAVLAQYYVYFDVNFKQYVSYCDCCHLEMHNNELIAHCQQSCSQPPVTDVADLEEFKDQLRDRLIDWKE